jgi:uncharacterized metal-binding protein
MESQSQTAPKLIFACSGAADVGEIADRATRSLTRSGAGKMYCLAGVGGQVPDIMERTRAAAKLLAIDGCDKDCAAHLLRRAGFTQFVHLRVTDLGMEKGKTPILEGHIATVAARGREALA